MSALMTTNLFNKQPLDRMIEAERPRAAFQVAHSDWKEVETARLKRLLLDLAILDKEPATAVLPAAFDISEALKPLDARATPSRACSSRPHVRSDPA